MKKICALILSLVMVFTLAVSSVGATALPEQITKEAIEAIGKVVINDFRISSSREDGHFWVDANGRTQAPVRVLVENMGYEITYSKGVVTIPGGPNGDLKFTIGSTTYTVGANKKTMDTVAAIIGGRTYVPLRFVAEALGAKVDVEGFGAENGATITITSTISPNRKINGVARKPFNACENMNAFLKNNTDILDASMPDQWKMYYVAWVTPTQEAELEMTIYYNPAMEYYEIDGLDTGERATKQYELVYALLKDTVENPDAIYAKLQERNKIVSKGWTNEKGITPEARAWRNEHDNKTVKVGNVNLTWSDYMFNITLEKASK